MLPFNYDPLDLAKRGIRLLRLLKSHAGPICCELFEVKVTDRGCDTPYEALSYVWGSPDLTHQIEVNGKELSITANLHVALSYLRLADTDQRGHQVQQMGDIYRQARQVVVWLGEATNETDTFMTVLQKIRTVMESEGSPYRNWVPKYETPLQRYWYERWKKDLRENMHMWHTDGTFSEYEMYCARHGLVDILDRSWFRRVWILQEVANASIVVVHCGNLSVPGLYFAAVEDIIK
ncbi:Heterokaryon incompatibility protein 6, OR allele [Colletotrichum siamense]|uniref:Heterokaryon incompatibility protein 6, OR allele n=1 Tax=Colletotrichum siamense TaxID=690259 RepID=UPI00187289E3|nr:Heterokaryon incompatibility protein 6, OR allele [Colletotrichum siamense]KAF5494452.1 Heterokaryon incompatibility protein 6, OR allele [Colletotrichum siamense]